MPDAAPLDGLLQTQLVTVAAQLVGEPRRRHLQHVRVQLLGYHIVVKGQIFREIVLVQIAQIPEQIV